MIIPYSKIINASVLELRAQAQVGVVSGVVIKKNDLSIYGLLLKNSFFDLFAPTKVISSLDIIEISNAAVVINDADNISDLKETVRIKEAVDKGYTGIGQLVTTKSGRRVGHVFDYCIETPSLRITNFNVKKSFSERIIPANIILKFEGRKITVKDDFEPIGVGAIDMEAA